MIKFECVICGQIKFCKSSLCRWCHHKIKKNKLKTREMMGVEYNYLFEWTEETDAFVRPLIYYLKNRSPDYFLEWMSYFKTLEFTGFETLIFPASSGSNPMNHSRSMALALAQLFPPLRVIKGEGVVRSSTAAQKHLSLVDRRKNFDKKTRSHVSNLKWIFVDDVLVSGSTLQACIDFYGLPKRVLTLVYRPVFGDEYEE